MTPTEKQKCIAEQVVYGDLKVLDRENELWTYAGLGLSESAYGDCALYDDNDNVIYDWIDEIKSILHPMSDLTKEITHKGYNDDKPFIPIVKLFEHLQGLYLTEQDKSDFEIFFNSNSDSGENDEGGWSAMIFDDLKLEINEHGVPAFFCYDTGSLDWKYNFITVLQSYFDILYQLHFDTRNLIATNEAIDVNALPDNPYEI